MWPLSLEFSIPTTRQQEKTSESCRILPADRWCIYPFVMVGFHLISAIPNDGRSEANGDTCPSWVTHEGETKSEFHWSSWGKKNMAMSVSSNLSRTQVSPLYSLAVFVSMLNCTLYKIPPLCVQTKSLSWLLLMLIPPATKTTNSATILSNNNSYVCSCSPFTRKRPVPRTSTAWAAERFRVPRPSDFTQSSTMFLTLKTPARRASSNGNFRRFYPSTSATFTAGEPFLGNRLKVKGEEWAFWKEYWHD